ncbi:hypothetical protein H5410_058433 [Solanum commersonii]|uniref:Uncharacterized protein n=1 Tax=Solanum commersonii TaxID=4109 RepID=A0A9J5WQS2_SOLCO|nr:hypothetical protein H5410_058433 [Solanum commersonii]
MAGADINSENLNAVQENPINPENIDFDQEDPVAIICGACETMKWKRGKNEKCKGCRFTPYFPPEKQSEFKELSYSFDVLKEHADIEKEYARLLAIARAEKKHKQEKKSYRHIKLKNKRLKRTIQENKDFMIRQSQCSHGGSSGGTGTATGGGTAAPAGTEGGTAAAVATGGGSGVPEEDLRGMGLDSGCNSNMNAWTPLGFTGGRGRGQGMTADAPSTSRLDEEEMLALGIGIRRQESKTNKLALINSQRSLGAPKKHYLRGAEILGSSQEALRRGAGSEEVSVMANVKIEAHSYRRMFPFRKMLNRNVKSRAEFSWWMGIMRYILLPFSFLMPNMGMKGCIPGETIRDKNK